MALPPIDCIYVTGDFLQELKNGNPSFKLPKPVSILRFLYELSWLMVHGELQIQKCKDALDAVEFSDKVSDDDLGSTFADIVTQMALDLTMSGENRARLIKLAKWLTESALVPLRFFQERCEEEFLWEAEMVKTKAQDLKSKEVRVNTRLLYQQTKFNLLREESEGYAKLVTLLCQGSEVGSQASSASTIGYIKSLIGHFDLDPNRVFDIVLECFELHPQSSLFLELIPLFPKSHASQILGFKFQYYQRIEVSATVPFGLYELAALLVKEDFIDLDSIYVHLLPKDEDAFDHYSAFSAKRLGEANKIGKINLAATGKDLMEDEKPGDVTVNLYTAVDMETEAVGERTPELENNQTLGLLSGFLSVGDWYHANILFQRLSLLNPVAHNSICKGLFRLIEKTIHPAYDIIRQRLLHNPIVSAGSVADSMDPRDSHHRLVFALKKEVFEMLSCAGAYLYRDVLLLQKVCIVLKGYHLSAIELTSNGARVYRPESGEGVPRLHLKEVRLRIEEALGSCLLPSLQLIPANPAVGYAIWEVMGLLPYEMRYRLYGEWEKDDERNPMILSARQTAKLDTRRILKRLAKENLKQLGRMVAKLAHANPMTVLRTIVHQIEAYKDMITPVVDAFKYLTQLEYDVLEYVVIERLVQGGREKIKDDGLNLTDWLQSLAAFWGHLCKKYPSMELSGLFQYLINQLKRGNGVELILLQELIQQMANVQYTENMTDEQLDAMAGGETLRSQATSFGLTRNNKALIKSTNRLRDSLLPKEDPKLAVPLLLLIAQHRSVVIINASAPYIKMVSEQFDRCHGILLQYVEFLCGAVTPSTAYAQLIPSLHDLIHLYRLDPEVAFLIYRPVMRHFKCQSRPDVCWPSSDDNAASPSANPDDLILDGINPGQFTRWSDLLDVVRSMLPSKAWNSLSPDLYATFWGLGLYDLYVPRGRYESEIAKLHAALKALEELSDNSSSAIAKRKKDKERIQDSLDRLANELKKHEENVASVRRRLSLEKDKWLSSCPDTLKINMEFLQRCIFPRCTFSMPDAVYCAMFVHTLHSLGTPFFNTVNHIDVLICKTLHPMICCCTEYEAGRLGRFLYETLRIAYHWKSDETIYERECGNMPGFAVYYRFPNSQRVTYAQFIKVHWKWSQRITRLLIQCLESTEYMEIRNALIMLTKISSVFPVTRKSGINIEKRVAKIKGEEREDLKVLATGVAAALAARKLSWVTEEEFGMGYVELKPAPSLAPKSLGGSVIGTSVSQSEPGGNLASQSTQLERAPESASASVKGKGSSMANGSDSQLVPSTAVQGGASNQRQANGSTSKKMDETLGKVGSKGSSESEARPGKRSHSAGSLNKPLKQELVKEDPKLGKAAEHRHTGAANLSSTLVINGNTAPAPSKNSVSSSRTIDSHGRETRTEGGTAKSSEVRGIVRDDHNEVSDMPRHMSSRSVHSPRHDTSAKAADKQQKRASPAEEPERINKRRKGESDVGDMDVDPRFADPRSLDKAYPTDPDKLGSEEQTINKASEKHLDRSKDKSEKYDRDHRDKTERIDKARGDDSLSEKSRDRSMERYARERSVEKLHERGNDRNLDRLADKAKDDRNKDDRGKLRYGDLSMERGHVDDRVVGSSLPPPPPLPPHVVPHSVSKRDDDTDRRFGSTRHSQRLSPRHEEKELRRSEENLFIAQDDARRRREDEFKDRKREDRDVLAVKGEERERDKERERERERERVDEMDANATSKRRKLKREHSVPEPGEYTPGAPPSHSLPMGTSQSYELRERGDRKGAVVQRAGYFEEPGMRVHGKEAPGKLARRDIDATHDRDYDGDKRQRVEPKRRHRK